MPYCELCGRKIEGQAYAASVEGATLVVCDRCASKIRTARPLVRRRQTMRARTPSRSRFYGIVSDDLIVHPNYPRIIKQARERMRLTQRELARLIREKESVISRIERGALRPSIELAKQLERVLRIKLVFHESDLVG